MLFICIYKYKLYWYIFTSLCQAEERFGQTVAPNISLNTIGNSTGKWELIAVALTGVCLQLGVLAFDAVAVYSLQWEKGGGSVPNFAFPFTLFGTLGVNFGMYLCARILEVSIKELQWEPDDQDYHKRTQRIVWVQKSQTVGDQGFGSFAIYAPMRSRSQHLMTSHRQRGRTQFHQLTLIASALTVGDWYSRGTNFHKTNLKTDISCSN